MNLPYYIAMASEDNGDPQSMRETSFVIHTASGSIIAMCKVGYKKPRSPYLCDYGIVDLVDCRVTINSLRLESTVPNRWSYSPVIRTFNGVVEPHRYESLRGIGVS